MARSARAARLCPPLYVPSALDSSLRCRRTFPPPQTTPPSRRDPLSAASRPLPSDVLPAWPHSAASRPAPSGPLPIHWPALLQYRSAALQRTRRPLARSLRNAHARPFSFLFKRFHQALLAHSLARRPPPPPCGRPLRRPPAGCTHAAGMLAPPPCHPRVIKPWGGRPPFSAAHPSSFASPFAPPPHHHRCLIAPPRPSPLSDRSPPSLPSPPYLLFSSFFCFPFSLAPLQAARRFRPVAAWPAPARACRSHPFVCSPRLALSSPPHCGSLSLPNLPPSAMLSSSRAPFRFHLPWRRNQQTPRRALSSRPSRLFPRSARLGRRCSFAVMHPKASTSDRQERASPSRPRVPWVTLDLECSRRTRKRTRASLCPPSPDSSPSPFPCLPCRPPLGDRIPTIPRTGTHMRHGLAGLGAAPHASLCVSSF